MLENSIYKIIEKYNEIVESYCKFKTDKGFFEMVLISGTGKELNIGADWRYRWPVYCYNKAFCVKMEDIDDKIDEETINSAVSTCCEDLIKYFQKNQEDGHTFVLRQNITFKFFKDPYTLDHIYSFFMRVTKVPDTTTELGTEIAHKIGSAEFELMYKHDSLGLLKGEGEILNIYDLSLDK